MAIFRQSFFFILICVALLTGCSNKTPSWQLDDVQGHLPDLKFTLTSDTGRTASEQDYRGKIVMLYFGYTHCPDVCPITMARLAAVMQKLGTSADNVRIVFVSVDPARDTPALLHRYVTAFDPHASGLTGAPDQIESLAKRYRVAYEAEKKNANGNYDVTHSSAVYIFDKDGHIRLLATPNSTIEAIVHDVQQLLQS